MKTILLSVLLCMLPHTLLSQEAWTAEIIVDDIYWNNLNEWNGVFHAVLYLEGVPYESGTLVHNWYRD